MHPIICQIGHLTIYSYGLMLSVAVFLCAFLAQRHARKVGIPPEKIFDLIFWSVIGGLLGARLFFIFLNLPYYFENPLEMIMLNRGGLAWQGGLIAGIAVAAFFIRLQGLDLFKTFDLLAPYVALGQAIGRLGCFLNGCCYGREAAWGIYFPVHHARLHPTQLYSSAGLFLIFWILRQRQDTETVKGRIFITYLWSSASLRFFVEFFRDDHAGVFLSLSIFQWVALGVILAAVYANLFLKSR